MSSSERDAAAVWSRWLDEHFGPGTDPVHLEYGDDREALARALARAVVELPQKSLFFGGWLRARGGPR